MMRIEKEIKWGIIGCGYVTEKKSGPAFDLVEGSRVTAVMSANADTARLYARERGLKKWYTDPTALINDTEVNAVYIASPPSTHATYAIMAMKAGKPVYVEKPMAASYDDCCRINRCSAETGVPCFVAYYRRYLPYFIKVREVVESGVLGMVQSIHLRFSCPPEEMEYDNRSTPFRKQKDVNEGEFFYDIAPHQLDILQDIFGCILEADGYTANISRRYTACDNITASFKFETGVLGSASWCFDAYEPARTDRVEVIGDKGMICFSIFTSEPIRVHTREGQVEYSPETPRLVQLPLIQAVVDHLHGFSLCESDNISATPANWVMDRILGRI